MKSTIILGSILFILAIYSIFVGVIDLDLSSILAGDFEQLDILILSRLPRLTAIILSGAALAVAGLIMQNLCMNKFVSPTTGATISSAQFGILIALLFLPESNLVSRAAFAFAFAIVGTMIFVAFILRAQFKNIIIVPLIGIMFGNIIGGFTSYLAFSFDMTQALSSWLVGRFSTIVRGNYEIVWVVLPLLILGFIFASKFNIVGMGRSFALNLGLRYRTVLLLGLVLAAGLTAAVVVVVGPISYIGLIVPNLISIFKGDNLRNTLVDTALFGAAFVLACDIVARYIIFPYELPIDLIVGMLGSIIFIILIFYKINSRQSKLSLLKNLRKRSTVRCQANG